MKIRFKKQAYQTAAVQAVLDCFEGQPHSSGQQYRIDPGRAPKPGIAKPQMELLAADQGELEEVSGFKNAEISPVVPLLQNIQKVQREQNLPVSPTMAHCAPANCPVNLDIEMETGTGKTYCYIKTMFEMNRKFGWSKFIIVVPSIAIREGVHKSFELTQEHFLEEFGKKARFFIYNSKSLHELESFSSDAGLNVMIINVQAFNARGKDNRRIYEELDDFQSRRPIDVIRANRPIVILDEPQKMEGKKTLQSFSEFRPLMILRYSATHKTEYNKIHRLDALDAYNQKLVKKIAVRGITMRGLTGTNAYLYLQSIDIAPNKPPVANIGFEVQQAGGIKRIVRKLSQHTNLFELSGELEQYSQGFVIANIDAYTDVVTFTNGVELQTGDVYGDVNEDLLRRIQIREALRAHLDKEQALFAQGIKVLSLFFIDEVAKYRLYDENGEPQQGEYARIFEEEYANLLNEMPLLENTPYHQYLQRDDVSRIHEGYFSIDKKKRLVDPAIDKRGETAGEAKDVAAYDLILKNKERLLSLEEPVRFIFSHSALREGWDNPNVFVICALKQSDNTISRRQEVGRGMRLAVNQNGDRMDDPAIVHQINVLSVIASESYKDFVKALQREIGDSLSARPRIASEDYFTSKLLLVGDETVTVTPKMAKQIYRYLVKNDYSDDNDHITDTYHEAKKRGELAELPEDLQGFAEPVFKLIDSVFSQGQLPMPEDERKPKVNPLSANFKKKEFLELWSRINRKAAYTVHFDTPELVEKCVKTIDRELKVKRLQYVVDSGEQSDEASYVELKKGEAFTHKESATKTVNSTVHSAVNYDLVGKLAIESRLTRATVTNILSRVNVAVFSQYRLNPEDFMRQAARLINEQKATVIVEHLAYDPIEERHSSDIFTQPKMDFSKAKKVDHHIYDYVFTDSQNERRFVEKLDASTEVVVYAKLPRAFTIPTPVGNYNPDWAIAFKEGAVRHVYFIAETKGSMSTMDMRKIETVKVDCARRFFAKISSDQVKYDMVDSYEKLMDLVVQ